MLRTKLNAAAIAAVLTFSIATGSSAQAKVNENSLHLRVGPGINATINTPSMRFSCGDDADCKFDVPSNSTFDVVAQSARGREFHWTGCSSLPEQNRCRVQLRDQAALVTVR
jgi:hypothetical protein